MEPHGGSFDVTVLWTLTQRVPRSDNGRMVCFGKYPRESHLPGQSLFVDFAIAGFGRVSPLPNHGHEQRSTFTIICCSKGYDIGYIHQSTGYLLDFPTSAENLLAK